jgi:small conductance mechanosensitive channel
MSGLSPGGSVSSAKVFEQLWDKVHGWLWALIDMLPNIAVALVVLVVFGLLSRLLAAIVRKTFERFQIVGAVSGLSARVVSLATLATGIILALSILELEKVVTSLLAGVGIVGLALGFAFQDLASNFVSGVALSLRHRYPFQIGDLIETNGFMGVAEHIYLRNSVIRTLDGNAVVMPNRKIYEDKLINYSADAYRRVELTCGVSYKEDLRKVKALVLEVASAFEKRMPERPVELFWTGYNDSSIDFQLRFWIPFRGQPDFLEARSEILMRIKECFDQHGITIPFPIRTLDFGAKSEILAELRSR